MAAPRDPSAARHEAATSSSSSGSSNDDDGGSSSSSSSGGGDDNRRVVLQVGSWSLRLGSAQHERPFTMPNVIAYRRRRRRELDAPPPPPPPSPPSPPSPRAAPLDAIVARRQREFQERAAAFRKHYKRKYQQSVPNAFFGGGGEGEGGGGLQELEGAALAKAKANWTIVKPDDAVRCVIGDEVLHLDADAPFQAFWPIVRGQFNSAAACTQRKVCDALEAIIRHAFRCKMQLSEFAEYSLVLVVSDEMCHREIAELHSILLNRLKFSMCSVHKESVLACFGAGVSTACVVDIGYEKTSVCCVRDGLVLADTCRTTRYGGSHLTHTLAFLLHQAAAAGEHHFALADAAEEEEQEEEVVVLNLDNFQHFAALDRVKIELCEFPPAAVDDARFAKSGELVLLVREKVYRCAVTMTMATFFTPQSLMFTALLPAVCYEAPWQPPPHPLHFLEQDVRCIDYLDKAFLDDAPMLQGRVKDRKVDKGGVGVGGGNSTPLKREQQAPVDAAEALPKREYVYGGEQDAAAERTATKQKQQQQKQKQNAKTAALSSAPTPLHMLVAESLAAVGDAELRQALCTQVLLVGGSAKFTGFQRELEDQLLDAAAAAELLGGGAHTKVEVIAVDRLLVDAAEMSWKGAAIITDNDECLRGTWIHASEWQGAGLGVHLLRARAAFYWD